MLVGHVACVRSRRAACGRCRPTSARLRSPACPTRSLRSSVVRPRAASERDDPRGLRPPGRRPGAGVLIGVERLDRRGSRRPRRADAPRRSRHAARDLDAATSPPRLGTTARPCRPRTPASATARRRPPRAGASAAAPAQAAAATCPVQRPATPVMAATRTTGAELAGWFTAKGKVSKATVPIGTLASYYVERGGRRGRRRQTGPSPRRCSRRASSTFSSLRACRRSTTSRASAPAVAGVHAARPGPTAQLGVRAQIQHLGPTPTRRRRWRASTIRSSTRASPTSCRRAAGPTGSSSATASGPAAPATTTLIALASAARPAVVGAGPPPLGAVPHRRGPRHLRLPGADAAGADRERAGRRRRRARRAGGRRPSVS